MLQTDIMIELHVTDFEKAKDFYGVLGFEVVWEREPEDKKGYLVMKKSNSIINFFCGNEHVYEQSYFKKFPKDTPRGYGVEIILPDDDIQSLYENIKQKYPKSIVEPLEKRYNRLDFRFVDPFGYYIRSVERYDWINGRDKKGNILNS